ncbi:hypothetical protein [Sphingomonas bacterium]|uniref:hypothetical protein n=1 Tax=Sphingomonas bacterium TaxID=1895847 RepID=UPI00261D337D|nr:hypothetical protein [Sphingomonas bacterium]
MGLFFFLGEYFRLRRLRFAALEGVRFWAIIAGSEIAIWLAVRSPDVQGRISIAAVAPLVIALIVNNVYAAVHRALSKGLAT